MMGQWSLMGGFIKAGESIEEAASRVLTDCTGIDNLFMEQVGATETLPAISESGLSP